MAIVGVARAGKARQATVLKKKDRASPRGNFVDAPLIGCLACRFGGCLFLGQAIQTRSRVKDLDWGDLGQRLQTRSTPQIRRQSW